MSSDLDNRQEPRGGATAVLAEDGPTALLVAARDGSAGAWDRLVEGIHPLLVHAAQRIDPAIAEDAAQEALLRLENGLLTGFVDDGNEHRASAWLCTIAANCARNLRRAERMRRTHERRAAAEPLPSEHDDAPLAYGDDERQQLRAALHELGERDREVLHWRYFEGLDLQGVCQRLGTSAPHAAVIAHRALGRLRTLVQRRGRQLAVPALVLMLRDLGASDHAQLSTPSSVPVTPLAWGAAAVTGALALWLVWAPVAPAATTPPSAAAAPLSAAPAAVAPDAPSPWAGLARGPQPSLRQSLRVQDGRLLPGRGHELGRPLGRDDALELVLADSVLAKAVATSGAAAGLRIEFAFPGPTPPGQPLATCAVGPADSQKLPWSVHGCAPDPDGQRRLVVLVDLLRLPDDGVAPGGLAMAVRHHETAAPLHHATLTDPLPRLRLAWSAASAPRLLNVTWEPLQPRPRVSDLPR